MCIAKPELEVNQTYKASIQKQEAEHSVQFSFLTKYIERNVVQIKFAIFEKSQNFIQKSVLTIYIMEMVKQKRTFLPRPLNE